MGKADSSRRPDASTAFTAMASPCLVLVDTPDPVLGAELGALVRGEARRIEAKFTRYQPSVVTRINERAGDAVDVDPETADLLDFAALMHRLSGGLFDITSGALRRIWRFDRASAAPSAAQVEAVLPLIGWHRVEWSRPVLRLQPGMEIDFGGIGKEYAVDRALLLAQAHSSAPLMVNFGGDLRVSGPRADGSAWVVGIEDVDRAGATAGRLELSHGALATSGDAYRHVMSDGLRLGHVLDPRSGWPIPDAPRSVTVHAGTCTEAGQLAKLALLSGMGAEKLLRDEGVRAWCLR